MREFTDKEFVENVNAGLRSAFLRFFLGTVIGIAAGLIYGYADGEFGWEPNDDGTATVDATVLLSTTLGGVVSGFLLGFLKQNEIYSRFNITSGTKNW